MANCYWSDPVPYVTNAARALSHELVKYARHRRHQLVGALANLDFWVAEMRHCLSLIDSYSWRFDRLKEAQDKFVLEHKVVEFDAKNPAGSKSDVAPPLRVRDRDLMKVRRRLCLVFYRFLVRCHAKKLLNEATLRKECDSLGIAVDAKDLKRR